MSTDPLLEVRGLSLPPALRNISFKLASGSILGISGPSGAGKSTLARCIARQETPARGEILLEGRAAWPIHEIQLIFQQPAASLNPRFTALEIVTEPLVILRRGTKQQQVETAIRWMEFVGLSSSSARKRSHEFSGGERQRLAIARALAVEPKLLILDESLSGLHLAIQSQIASFLHGQTCILITHDLALAANLAGRIAVMDSGAIVEEGPSAELRSNPRHPCTQELVSASLTLAAGRRA